MEQFSTIKSITIKAKPGNETSSVTPSIVKVPDEKELKALLEKNELLKAKVFRQAQAIGSVLEKKFKTKPS